MKRTNWAGKNKSIDGSLFRERVRAVMNESIITSRSTLARKAGQSFGGKRDIYEALGYPQVGTIQYDDYMVKYLRQDIAGRLIDAPVIGSWEHKPIITNEEAGSASFTDEWNSLVKKHKIWHTLIRADKLSRIGRFGCLLLGFDDVNGPAALKKPVKRGKRKLLYMQPFGEGSVKIVKFYTDISNEKFGYPEIYSIQQEDGNENITSTRTLEVHESRIIHISENLLTSNIYGQPELERVYNRLINLETIVGGSAEMFWQGAFPGYAFIADGEADMTQTAGKLEDEIDMFVHDFKRYMKLQGLKVEKLSSDVASPKDHVDIQILMISISSGIPIRILTGSERGSLASSQDEGHWNDKLNSRRKDFLEPMVIRELIDRLMKYKVLPEEVDYVLNWPDLNTPTDKDKAEIGKLRAQAIKEYASVPEMQYLMSFEDFLSQILRLDDPTVQKIIVGSAKALQDALDREEETQGDEPEEGEDLDDNNSE